jgi:hypothetical protein
MAQISNIEEFKSRLVDGGARPTLFYVTCNFPTSGSVATDKDGLTTLSYMAKAASIPESIVSNIDVGFFGRRVKLAGDRTYNNWAVSIINSEDFRIRNAFEEWHSALNAPVSNTRGLPGIASYKKDVTVTQLSQDGFAVRTYKLIGVFPIQIGAIDLSWDNQNTIEEFPVTFAYDYWTLQEGASTPIGPLPTLTI